MTSFFSISVDGTWRVLRGAAVVAALVVGIGVCDARAAGASPAEQSNAAEWKSCALPEFAGWIEDEIVKKEMLCGYVVAPLAYRGSMYNAPKSKEPTVRLAIVKLPARGERLGSVLTIAGGPGQSGLAMAALVAHSGVAAGQLSENYDFIGFDPRGVGHSVPKISCAPDSAGPDDVDHRPPQKTGLQLNEAAAGANDFVDGCIRGTGLSVLKHIGTNEAANDIEGIRLFLHESKLNIISYSYGTLVAELYADRYPRFVRSIVLDGVVDITEDGLVSRLNQSRSLRIGFDKFVEYCAEYSNCPLPSTAPAALDYLRRLLARDNAAAMEGEGEGYANLMEATIPAMLWPENWRDYFDALVNLTNGDATSMRKLADAEGGGDGALSAITCADTARQGLSLEELKWYASNLAETELDYTVAKQAVIDVCDVWPFPGAVSAKLPVRPRTLPDLLFVTHEADGTTPYASARRMADFFRSPLLTKVAQGHTVALIVGDPCIDSAVAAYILHPEVERADQVCQ